MFRCSKMHSPAAKRIFFLMFIKNVCQSCFGIKSRFSAKFFMQIFSFFPGSMKSRSLLLKC